MSKRMRTGERMTDKEDKSLPTNGHKRRRRCLPVQPGRGIPPSEFDTYKNAIAIEPSEGGYFTRYVVNGAAGRIIRGIELEGMFHSTFVEGDCQLLSPDSDDDDFEDYSDNEEEKEAGWFVPDTAYSDFSTFWEKLQKKCTEKHCAQKRGQLHETSSSSHERAHEGVEKESGKESGKEPGKEQQTV